MKIVGGDSSIKLVKNTYILCCEWRGTSFTELQEHCAVIAENGGSGAEIRDFVWAALKAGARKAKKPFEFDNFDVGDWMDDLTADELTEFFNEVSDSMESKMPSENGGGKKKEAESQR